MKLSDFDFDLPAELIAQTPQEIRDRSRLMVVDRNTGTIEHAEFHRLPRYLGSGRPLMVFNNTRVIPAKLIGCKKGTQHAVEMLLVREIEPQLWEALVKGLKKLRPGTEFVFGDGRLTAVLENRKDDKALLRLNYSGDLSRLLEEVAHMPLPPYIRRNSGDSADLRRLDRERYQTVYAAHPGAIAAPTAGLHFTKELLEKIEASEADTAFVTLHVGVGTFKPIHEENIGRHIMEEEEYHVPTDTWNRIYEAKREGRKVLAVGTTTTRVLESISVTAPAEDPVSGRTRRFIYPGYRFQTIDQLLTNFHLPKSTLYLMVCAFAGKELIQKAYREAVRQKYRFFSYGDAMLIL